MKIKEENLSKMTIKDFINQKDKFNQKEKEYVIRELFSLNYTNLFLKEDEELTKKDLKKIIKILNLSKKIPIQYCFSKAYFLNEEYYVNKNVLIPRPETEYLVVKTNELIKKYFSNEKINILEIGTGSGIIAISLKMQDEKRNITATDISKKALKVARRNAISKNVSINFIKKDILKMIEGKYDILISNPPYIPYNSKNVLDIVKNNEPKKALYAKDEGLFFYKEILKNAKNVLNKNNIIAFETGEDESDLIEKIAKIYFPSAKIIKENDLNNFNRYIFIINFE